MSRWARIQSQLQERPQGSLEESKKAPLSADSSSLEEVLEAVLNYCQAASIELFAEDTDDLIEELETWSRVPALEEDKRQALLRFVETIKKIVFKMLDKSKKTVVTNDDDDDKVEEQRGYFSSKRLTEAKDDEKKKGRWNIILRKVKSKVRITIVNPRGGSGSSDSASSFESAMALVKLRYARAPLGKAEKIWVVRSEWDGQQYKVKKAGWINSLSEATMGTPTPHAGSESMLGRPRPAWMNPVEPSVKLKQQKQSEPKRWRSRGE